MSAGNHCSRGSGGSGQAREKRGGSSSGGKAPFKGAGGSGGGGGTLPPSVTPAAGPSSHIPQHLSFIFLIEPLHPDYQVQPINFTTTSAWRPPTIRGAYTTSPGTFWWWRGGRVTPVPPNDPVITSGLTTYRTATVFSQYPSTAHLLVVPFDARTRNVNEHRPGWPPISFYHEELGSDAEEVREFYSSVSAVGPETHIAAPGQAFWMPQLLNTSYNYSAGHHSRPRRHAGLTGSLPILLALAIFSAPEVNLAEAMSSLQPGAWRPHRHRYPSGYTPERGAVITVFLDPRNPQHSSIGLLDQLQNGDFGPFYGRHPAPATSSAAIPTRPTV